MSRSPWDVPRACLLIGNNRMHLRRAVAPVRIFWLMLLGVRVAILPDHEGTE